MNGEASAAAVDRFRDVVGGFLGLQLDMGKTGSLAALLERRSALAGGGVARYLDRLAAAPEPRELGALAGELTVSESYFFRNSEQFRALREVVLPERLRVATERPVRLLSAGCAAGEELYSLAIVAREELADPSHVRIHGVELNPAMVEKARSGRYSSWTLRETPTETARRWFRRDGREVVLAEAVRDSVEIAEGNLADAAAPIWRRGAWDVVFCRNVLMYFTPESAAALVARLARLLATGGYLFLGHAETLRGISTDFHLRHSHCTFYYQRKEELDSLLAGPRRAAPPAQFAGPVAAGLGVGLPGAEDWIEAIRSSAARIDALASALPVAHPRVTGAAGARVASRGVKRLGCGR